uniref:Mitochondrial ribosomal protein L54 n=1 Tax=Globodera rostochiensis TaxID=31243 RepID=A0A914GSP1_GLORO
MLISKTAASAVVQRRNFAAPPKKSSNLPEEQEESFVDVENAEQLCKYVCINYEVNLEGPGPAIKPDSEYPEWLFKLDTEPSKELEDLDPECDGWKYWEKWEERRQQQMLRHDELKYKYFWLQHSPALGTHLRFTQEKYKSHKFLTIPVTTPGLYLKHTRRRRLGQSWWKSLEESEQLMKTNDGWGTGAVTRN